VFDLASKAIGSKADAVLTILDKDGRVLASNNDFDSSGDPLISYTFNAAGRYTAVVGDLQMAGSADHFYRLSAGEFPLVTAVFPLSIPANAESEVELIGTHLPADRKVKVQAGASGEMTVPLPASLRARREFRVLVSDLPAVVEAEPNDDVQNATVIPQPASCRRQVRQAGRCRSL
jgi:hypothetical protein